MFEAKTGGGSVGSGSQDRMAGEIEAPPTRTPAKKPVCIVLHQEHSNPGHVGQWFVRNGHPLDIRKPRFGEPMPETLENHCGAVIFGGPMSANDKDAFIGVETDWIGVALQEKKPFLGICLGAQMLTNHLGGRVGFHPEEKVEIGYYPLVTTDAGKNIGPFPDHVYQWHREGCELPSGMRLLATSDGPFPNQAFACGSALGVQFHPEITYAQVHRWTGHNTTRLLMNGARERGDHIAGHVMHGAKVQSWLDALLRRWVKSELTIG
jgi:GMP synthase (glutamine-hydrolysing)